MNPLHPDFPETPERPEGEFWTYNLPTPLADIQVALEHVWEKDITVYDLDEITDYYVEYHGAKWTPGDPDSGSELALYVVARMTTGFWIALDAYNDYTGWGCQDGVDHYIGTSREDVIANGLTNDARSALGLELVQ